MSIIDPGVGHLITKDIHHELDRPRGGTLDYKRYSSMSMIDQGAGHFTTKIFIMSMIDPGVRHLITKDIHQ